jgi:hypothetical protein
MLMELKNQFFNVDTGVNVYHLCNGECDPTTLEKIIHICKKAIFDPIAIHHCFYVDDYLSKPTTLLFQFFHKNMNLILIEAGSEYAIMGYSIYGNVVLCPRRVYVAPSLRGINVFTKYVMEPLDSMFINLGVRYLAMTFNKTKTGLKHFRLYGDRSNLRKVMTKGGYFTDFMPLSPEAINMFENEQYVVYKKLNSGPSNIPDLTVEQFNKQLSRRPFRISHSQ